MLTNLREFKMYEENQFTINADWLSPNDRVVSVATISGALKNNKPTFEVIWIVDDLAISFNELETDLQEHFKNEFISYLSIIR